MLVYAKEFAAAPNANRIHLLNSFSKEEMQKNIQTNGEYLERKLLTATGFNIYSDWQLQIGWLLYSHTSKQSPPIVFGRCQEVNVRTTATLTQKASSSDQKDKYCGGYRSGGIYVNPRTLQVEITGNGLEPRDNWSTMLNDSWVMGGIHHQQMFLGVSNAAKANIYTGNAMYPITVSAREQMGLLLGGYHYHETAAGRIWEVPSQHYGRAQSLDWGEYKAFVDKITDETCKNGAHPVLDGLLGIPVYEGTDFPNDFNGAGTKALAETATMNMDGKLIDFLAEKAKKQRSFIQDLHKSVVGKEFVRASYQQSGPGRDANKDLATLVIDSIRKARKMAPLIELCKNEGFIDRA